VLDIVVVTLFPEFFPGPLQTSILGRAAAKGLVRITVRDLRDWTHDRHNTADDAPYGGGAGMVMKVDSVVAAWRGLDPAERGKAIVMSAKGRRFDQALAREWSRLEAFTLVCGRYKGIDERVVDLLDADEVSIGDFVLAGGELAAAVMIEAVARLLPGVLGDAQSGEEDSHEDGLLGYPDYTRPEEFEGRRVPEVLLSGHHANIARWRRERRLEATWQRRPDLLEKAELTESDRKFLERLRRERQAPDLRESGSR
jgi:tRNA (guanine37-N1)-methyltransferase